MQFGYTILYVEDVPATLAFYGEAFGLATRYTHESGSYGELETGATALAFVSHALLTQIGKTPQSPHLDKPTSEIALVTDDVAAAVRRAVDAGARPVQPPTDMPWGQTIAYVGDCNGFLVEICTPVKHG
ncbi:VOC family protein [Scleromatobacter humisilvae]|uniref:VOC family protein n=1 Tax=Scleromatobacter humisilvae TaxID=2897159 RepID=A0A9X1YMT2_9BURK|nr:VOC family protein [Scleromatobacter humisilvae]MCK9689048.1 VOC family protein [Scleromatobacter humisilvae]